MSQTRAWTEQEQKILKYIRDEEGVQKWSTIAQKMAEEYGIKGRNGKQCKQRYMEVFDENKEVLHWDYQAEQMMFVLHDKIGNKWAAIGQQLNNRTDNDVKNHFYSKIRKGLRKINYLIKDHFKKQIKQIKQTVLYKIIEGAEDRFNPAPIYDPDTWTYCTEAKNFLLKMSYDEEEYNPWENFYKYAHQIKDFVQNMYHFSKDFQRKPKPKKNDESPNDSELSQSLHASCILQKKTSSHQNMHSVCDSDIESSQFDESQSPDIQRKTKKQNGFEKRIQPPNYTGIYQQNRAQLSPIQPKKSQKVNPVIILKSSNELNEIMMMQERSSIQLRHNEDKIQKEQKSSKPTQSLILSIPKLTYISSKANAMLDEEDEDLNLRPERSVESQLEEDGILEEEEEKNSRQFFLFGGSGSKKIKSKGSNFSSFSMMEEEDRPFFGEDSTLDNRIFTMGVGGKMHHEMSASIDKSEKLFKSLERSGKLFESLESRGKKIDLEMSIEISGDLNRSDFMAQSVGK